MVNCNSQLGKNSEPVKMSGILLILVPLTFKVIQAGQSAPLYPLLSKPVGVGQPRSWGKMLSDPEMSSRLNRDNHLGEMAQENQVTSNNNVNVLELLQTLRQNLSSLEVEKYHDSKLTTNIKKRKTDPLSDVLEEVYEDYGDDKEAVWTSVGNGRVKIWPLSFGRIKINDTSTERGAKPFEHI